MRTAAVTLIIAVTFALPHVAAAQSPSTIVPPPMPGDLEVDSGFVPFLAAHAIGTQNYVCVAVDGAFSWAPYGPQATLYDEYGGQVLTHFLSPTPYSLVPGPTWQHSRDSSLVWGQIDKISNDAQYVAPDAIPWLLLEAAVVGDGPTGGDKLLQTRYIQRLNTVAGKAPTVGCSQSGDIAKRALVPYEADYYFYKAKKVKYED
jgi:hypothetical protein